MGNNLDDHLNNFSREHIKEPIGQGRYSRGVSPMRQSYGGGGVNPPFFEEPMGRRGSIGSVTDRYPQDYSRVMNGSYIQPVIQPIVQPIVQPQIPQFNVNPLQPYPSMSYPNYGGPSMEATTLAGHVEKQTQLLEAIKSKLEKPGSETSRRNLDSRDLEKRLREIERENELKLQLTKQQQMIELLTNNQYQQKADLFPKYYDPMNNYGVRPQGTDIKDKIIEQQAALLQNLMAPQSNLDLRIINFILRL